jgi:hypothetical protein
MNINWSVQRNQLEWVIYTHYNKLNKPKAKTKKKQQQINK